jgi:hypothetical protein
MPESAAACPGLFPSRLTCIRDRDRPLPLPLPLLLPCDVMSVPVRNEMVRACSPKRDGRGCRARNDSSDESSDARHPSRVPRIDLGHRCARVPRAMGPTRSGSPPSQARTPALRVCITGRNTRAPAYPVESTRRNPCRHTANGALNDRVRHTTHRSLAF